MNPNQYTLENAQETFCGQGNPYPVDVARRYNKKILQELKETNRLLKLLCYLELRTERSRREPQRGAFGIDCNALLYGERLPKKKRKLPVGSFLWEDEVL